MKRIQYEDVSKYRNNIELNGRYLLLNLIGKGGFSEVYKAYDYQDQMMVAIKIHQINPEWPEQKKSDYQKWVPEKHKVGYVFRISNKLKFQACSPRGTNSKIDKTFENYSTLRCIWCRHKHVGGTSEIPDNGSWQFFILFLGFVRLWSIAKEMIWIYISNNRIKTKYQKPKRKQLLCKLFKEWVFYWSLLGTPISNVDWFESKSIGWFYKTQKALKYLNELDKPVIHYDLKPGKSRTL